MIRAADFNDTLADVTSLLGRRVTVTVSGRFDRPPVALVTTGVLLRGDELLAPGLVHDYETYYIALHGAEPPSGILIYKEYVQSSWWEGSTLNVPMGMVVLKIQATD